MLSGGGNVDVNELLDLATPWCLRVLVTLHIPELVEAGHNEISDPAEAAGCDARALHGVLTHAARKGVFEERQPGWFEVNPAAKELARGSRDLDLSGVGSRYAQIWSTLLSYTRTGKSAYAEIYGRPLWEDLVADPELARSFDALLKPPPEHGVPDSDFEITGGWDRVRTIVDVGGAIGVFLSELLQRHPRLHGTLLDLPETVARATDVLDWAGVSDRVKTAGQSFFDPLPAGADLYLLRRVLIDWSDEDKVRILRRCADAARPGGRVVVIGGVSPDETPGEVTAELLMLGGWKDTMSEFRDLARAAGLAVTVASTQPPANFIIECLPLPGQAPAATLGSRARHPRPR
jgi:2,7-dihydroxy-5-methyl-1-naphthoate 7-O-methyltransferase